MIYVSIYNIFYSAFNDFTEGRNNDIKTYGKTKILEQPEYNDASTIKKIAYKLDDEDFIKHIVKDKDNDEIKIYIGQDSEVDENTTVIKRKYNINGETGTIAVIGPKRMEYAKVFGLLDYVLNEMSKKEE